MKKINKKKGFTLVELIAVIAILGILAAVIVPRISGYSDRATLSKEKANAQTILNAIELYNQSADAGKTIDTGSTSAVTLADINAGRYDATAGHTLSSTVNANAVTDLETTVGKVTGNTSGRLGPGNSIADLYTVNNAAAYGDLPTRK